MEAQNPHEQELKQIFDQLPPAKLYGDNKEEVKLINYPLLETIVGKMMDKAYYHGKTEGLDQLESMMNEAFSH